MALKVIMMRHNLDRLNKELEAILAKDESFVTREAELEAAINEVETDEQREAVAAEVEAFDAEKTGHEEAKADLVRQIEELETELENIYKGMVAAGSKVIKAKGATFYAIAASTVQLIKALVADTDTILSLATYLDGEYGAKNLCTGVLCKVGGCGFKQIIELPLPEDEMKLFSEKLESLDKTFEALNVR